MDIGYPIRLHCTEEKGVTEWVVEYPDLPGCIGVGNTPEKAFIEGKTSKEMWLKTAIENGIKIPESPKIIGAL